MSHARIFQRVLFLGLISLPECIIPYHFLRIIDVLEILFCTNPDIYMVNLDRLFMQGWVNGIMKGIGDFQDKNNEAFCRCNFYNN